jgi:predicted dienelactone hydrolase
MSTKEEGGYLAEHLASHGYVVVSADYPLTNFRTAGGPNVSDAANQPADVSFLIDRVLALQGDEKPFAGAIDRERIGAMGLSLGGLTTTLAAFHRTLRDPRIRAAVSIAGPSSFFSEHFFAAADVPFLMIAGTEDAMVDYRTNARPILDRVRNAGLLSIAAGSHTGFAGIADPLFRFVDHPDSTGCSALMANIDLQQNEFPFTGLGGEENGIVIIDQTLPCQKSPLPKALHPGRQHMITTLGATDFFRSIFDADKATRESAARHLSRGIAGDFPEASYEASRL